MIRLVYQAPKSNLETSETRFALQHVRGVCVTLERESHPFSLWSKSEPRYIPDLLPIRSLNIYLKITAEPHSLILQENGLHVHSLDDLPEMILRNTWAS